MTVMSAQTIKAYCLDVGMIEPFHERTVRNGKTFGLSACGYDVRIAESLVIPSYSGFMLASTMEKFNMPINYVGIVHDKSSWARRGIAVQNTVIEPGWRGYLTLELTNHSSDAISLQAGDPIAQIIFHKLDEATQQPYQGKYQDQAAGPQTAKDEQ